MVFYPTLSTLITANPVLWDALFKTLDTSVPAALRLLKTMSANWSLPTALRNTVSAPSFAQAQA